MPEIMHGTEPGLMGSGDTVTLLGTKVWEAPDGNL